MGISVSGGGFESLFVVLEEDTARAKKEVAVELDKRLERRTPVDTGRARSKWIFKSGTGDAYDNRGSERGEMGSYTRSKDDSAEGLSIKKLKKEDVLISNNTPYIEDLNSGHSKQAPAMFVELSMKEALNAVFK